AVARELAWRFSDLPLADKTSSRKPIKGAYRGYITADDENLSYMQNEASPPDLNEFFGFGQFGYGDDPYYRQSFAEACRSNPGAAIGWTYPAYPTGSSSMSVIS